MASENKASNAAAHPVTRPRMPRAGIVVLSGLLFIGLATQPLKPTKSAFIPMRELDAETALLSGGSSLGLAALGGWRTIAADFLWLRVQAAWERRDLPATHTAILMVTQMDPRPILFWLNGARMIAYDMPEWRIEAAGGHDRVPIAWRDKVYAEHARLGLELLDRARAHLGEHHALWVEAANIFSKKLQDYNAAAECFRRAALQPNAPYYVARLHAEMLRRSGRQAEALAYLVRLHPSLPPHEEEAMAPLVLSRIQELENELQIDPRRRYRPGATR